MYKKWVLVFRAGIWFVWLFSNFPDLKETCVLGFIEMFSINKTSNSFLCSPYFVVPRTGHIIFADRAFSVYGPKLWNKLPNHIRDTTSFNTIIQATSESPLVSGDLPSMTYFCPLCLSASEQTFWLRYFINSWLIYFSFCFYMQVARHTRPEGHFKVWATINYLSRGRYQTLLGLKQGYPLYSPYGCRLVYHPSEAWLVEQESATSPAFVDLFHCLIFALLSNLSGYNKTSNYLRQTSSTHNNAKPTSFSQLPRTLSSTHNARTTTNLRKLKDRNHRESTTSRGTSLRSTLSFLPSPSVTQGPHSEFLK